MKKIKTYESFNARRFGNPWVAKVNKAGKIDFSERVGGYTGGYGRGEAGSLFVAAPQEGQIYAFGQKDYRGNRGGYDYAVFLDGEFKEIEKAEIIDYLK